MVKIKNLVDLSSKRINISPNNLNVLARVSCILMQKNISNETTLGLLIKYPEDVLPFFTKHRVEMWDSFDLAYLSLFNHYLMCCIVNISSSY
jgi:hypothetical protein